MGLFILYSASNQSIAVLGHQAGSLGLAFCIMFILAQVPPHRYQSIAPWLFGITLILLLIVLVTGAISKGAQRWLNLGIIRFQPSEIMKIAMPMMLAWYLQEKNLPPKLKTIFTSSIMLLIPVFMIARQPDLGTAIIITATGLFVIFLSGISWRFIFGTLFSLALLLPIGWYFLHDYQKARILTFLNPERDHLKSGYHIIQSKIAIGSGGFLGQGWLHGSQTHLQFLPEHTTDFIFGVCGEELGFIGSLLLIGTFAYVVARGLYISKNAQDSFTRLLAGSLTLTFFLSFFVNIGMVIGILPVVGLPLPLISYGGSSLVTLMAAFGIIMSIRTHRKLLSN
jgi:rod shape determining protein RodA